MRRPKGWWKWYFARIRALADKAYETTMVVTDGDREAAIQAYSDYNIRYHWHDAGQNSKQQEVFFCWTIYRDRTGYYRTWREVHTSTTVKRYDVARRKTKAGVAEIARRRYNKFIGAEE